MSTAVISARRGSKCLELYDNAPVPIINTNISRFGSADDGWLDVDAAPLAAGNQGAFFCPFLFMSCDSTNGNVTGTIDFVLEWTVTVECRGSKL